MTIQKLAALITALTVIAGAVLWPINHFQSRAEAAQAKEEVQKKMAQTETELKIDILREKLARLNAKAEKGKLSADDEDDRKFTRELISKLQEAALKKEGK